MTTDDIMKLRDWFAGQALASMNLDDYEADVAARWAYKVADAMLEARQKPCAS